MDAGTILSFLLGGGGSSLILYLLNNRQNRATLAQTNVSADAQRVEMADSLWQKLAKELEEQEKRHQVEIDALRAQLSEALAKCAACEKLLARKADK